MIVSDGWRSLQDNKPNTDLIPAALIVARYFAGEQAVSEERETECDAIGRQMEEMDEEHGGEEGLLAEARTERGKLTRISVKARLTEIRNDKEAAEERALLGQYLALVEQEAAASRGQGDAVVHISAAALGNIPVTLPALAEQTAIATVLSAMDAELSALEARRDKTRDIKQGMMQELLTGRIRLLEHSALDKPQGAHHASPTTVC